MDSFKDELEKIAREAQKHHETEHLHRERRARKFRDNVEEAFKKAVAFNSRVIARVLADFSSGAPGAGEFTCDFKESESQPEFVHSCEVHGRKLTVSLLYWIAGSARLTCDFGYVTNDEPFSIKSFDEPDLDTRVQTWLKSRLLEKYRTHLERNRLFNNKDV